MKRWMLFLCLLIVSIIGGAYFIIPAKNNLTYEITVNSAEDGIARLFLNKEKIVSWFPGKKINGDIYQYKNCKYRIDKITVSGLEITIFNDKDSIKGILEIISAGAYSTGINWGSSTVFSSNPIKKISQYSNYSNLKNNIKSFITEIKDYFDKEENIYGIKVVQQKVIETSLISLKQTFNHYPSIKEIYELINSIKEYIKHKGGEEKDYPMLNVHTEDSVIYETMVAIPTTNDLSSEGKFILKKMMVGNILMAEVKGGIYRIINGEEQLKNYVSDHKKISPAIPFQSLVTDRLLEPDTSKWVTRLYYPIF